MLNYIFADVYMFVLINFSLIVKEAIRLTEIMNESFPGMSQY